MAENIKVGIEVSDNGSSGKTQKNVQNLKDVLDQTAESAGRVGRAVAAASAGRAARSAAAMPTGAAGVSAGISGSDVEGYNRLRGSAGAAGGTARDFADQARGLGGLVRLYATVAANTFALTAAFGALSRAMDTTNMVKGLDQLGAASGVALGSLSKRLVTATDGALSLREAMEATTKAVSSGMNSDDVLRLGKVAKQASQALGVDMGDAVSRLTRGITKLEPELLDELGIFTKLDPAVKEYAKSVNKSVSELSDFERRQAFANAVLAEGEQKFNAINIDTNPYTKLSAAVRDTTQNILEFINKIVGPVAGFFSQSPSALIAGITALAAVLVKQALPAIGEFKLGLEQSAKRAQDLAIEKAAQAQQARKLIDQRIIDEVESRADKELKAVEVAEAKIQQLQQGTLNKRSAAYKLLSKDLQDIQEKDLKRVESAAKGLETRGKTAEAAAYREVVTSIRAQIQAEKDLVETRKSLTQQVEKDAQSWGTYGLTVKAGQKAQEAATRAGIISNAAYNGSLIGLTGSFKLLREEIAKNNITGFSAAMLTVRGTLAAVGGALSVLTGFLNGFFMVIGLVTAALSLLEGIFGKAGKELSTFSSSVDRTQGAAKNLSDTFDKIYTTNPFSVQSLEARSNSINEFSASLDELTKSADKALQALQRPDAWFDRLKNSIKNFAGIGFDIQSTFTSTLGEGIVSGVKAIDDKAIADQLKTKLSSILSVKDVTNLEEVDRALKGLKPTSSIVLDIRNAFKQAGDEAKTLSNRAREVVTTFDASKEAFRELSKQFEVNDPITKWANTSIVSLSSLAKNLQDPITNSLSNLAKITSELDKSPIFGSSSVEIAKLNEELKETQKIIVNSEIEDNKLRTTLAGLESDKETGRSSIIKKAAEQIAGPPEIGTRNIPQAVAIIDAEIDRLRKALEESAKVRAKAQASAERVAQKVSSKISEGLTESIDLVATGLSAALSKGSTQVLQSLYARIDNIPELATKQFDLKIKELDQQERLIKSQQELSNRIVLLTAQVAVNSAQQAVTSAEKDVNPAAALGDEAFKAAQQNLDRAKKDLVDASGKLELLTLAATNPLKALDELKLRLKDAANGAKVYAQEIVDAANRNAGFKKSLQDIEQQRKLINLIEKPLAEEQAAFKAQKDQLDIRTKANTIAREELQLQLSTNQGNETEVLSRLRVNQLQQASIDLDSRRLDIQNNYNNQAITASGLARLGNIEEAKKVALNAVSTKQQQEQLAIKQFAITLAQVESSIIDKILQKQLDLLDKEYKLQEAAREVQKIREDTAISLRELELETIRETNKYRDEYVTQLTNQFEIFKINEEAKRRETDITSRYQIERAKLTAQLIAEGQKTGFADTEGPVSQRAAELAADIAALDQRSQAEIGSLRAITAARISSRKEIQESKKAQDEFNKSIEELKGLDTVFKGIGTTLADIANNLKTAADSQKQYAKERERLTDVLNSGLAEEDRLQVQKELDILNKKSTRDQLANDAKIAGSTKNLFKEKTAAHKTLAAIEKANAVASLAINAQQIFANLASLPAKIAGGVANLFSQGGFAGFPASAAFLALMATLGFGRGKAATPPQGFTAEEQQKVQGTGQTYRGGELVTRAGGVLGDPTAKAESVAKSLELVSKNTFEGLQYSDKMLEALKSIDQNTKGLTLAMLRSFAPGRGGLAESIPTGQLRGNIGNNMAAGGLLGAGLGAGAAAFINIGSAISGGAALGGLAAGLAGALGGFLLPGIGLLLAKPLGKLIGNLLGGKVTQTVEDFGIAVTGALGEITAGTGDLIKEYANVKRVTDVGSVRRFFGSENKVDFIPETGPASEAIQQAVGRLFVGIKDSLISAGELLGRDVSSSVSNFIVEGFRVTMKDQKPEDIAKAIEGEVSIVFNQIAEAAFGDLVEQFGKPFEEAGETIIRLAKQTQVFTLAMTSIGKSVEDIAPMLKFGIADSLIEAAGGIEKFVEQTKFFADNFLSESERLAPVQKALTEELGKLGLSSLDTKEEFKTLVQALDLTQQTDRELYQSLMNLAPAFSQVYKETQKLLTEEELKSKIYDQETKVLQILGKNQELLNRARQKELDELSKLPKAQSDALIANQKYIYALEDEVSARDKLKKRLDDTVSGLKSAIENITNYRKQLIMSDKTVLTPMEQYQQAQKEFERIKAEATTTAVTEEQRKQQLDAINKLPQAADAFLGLSRTMFASGSQYASDFAVVSSALDQVESSSTTQLSVAESSLRELETSRYYLGEISQSTSELLTAWKTAYEKATGLGPTDTTMILPQAVPAQQNNNAEVVEQLKEVRQQLEKLREEQAAQAAAQLINNAQVNAAAATRVVEAVEETNDSTWDLRMRYKVPGISSPEP